METEREAREGAVGEATPRRFWAAERVFPPLVLAFGLVYAFAMPPCQPPDENTHFHRAYSLSMGHLRPTMVRDGWGGDMLPASAARVPTVFGRLWTDMAAKVPGMWGEISAAEGHSEPEPVTFAGANMYTFAGYAPSAAGIALARAVGLGAIPMFFAGRLANLALSIVLVTLALRVAPAYKAAFGSAALMPISVQQFASYSPDSTVIAAILLLVALILRSALNPGRVASNRTVAAIIGLTAWITLCKFPYAMVALLYATLPASSLGSRRRQVLVGLTLAAVVVGLVVASERLSRGTVPNTHPLIGNQQANLSEQKAYLLHHKLKFVKICARTCVEYGAPWLVLMSFSGVNVQPNLLAFQLFLIFLFVLSALDQPSGPLPRGLKPAAMLATLLAFGLMMTSQYIWHTAVGANRVEGTQGRYLVPLLPLLPLILHARSIRITADPGTMLGIAVTGSVAMLVVAIGTWVQRFYLPDPAQLLKPERICAAGVAVVVAGTLMIRYLPLRVAPAGAPFATPTEGTC